MGVFRSMKQADGMPLIENSATGLGVRIEGGSVDIKANAEGIVQPGTGGMSTAPAWRLLKSHRIPMRLKDKCGDAAGRNNLHCWRLGDLPFVAGPVDPQLRLRVDKPDHAMIEPAHPMPLTEYCAALAATGPRWIIDEV